MAQFQKPENALKRAEELIEVGNKKNALDTLKDALNNRKWRNNWSPTIEKIIIKYLELCVELKKISYAREGLIQYRGTCQAANIGSLELVVQTFRKAAEEKINEALQQQENAMNMQDMEDLDEKELPHTILLRSIQAHDTRQQSQDREVTAHFRFSWDTYRIILDVLKSNVRLEEVYHETARHAFEFCRVNKRQQEFRRLCEILRKNYTDLSKPRSGANQHQVNPGAYDTVTRTIDTRFAQLRTATELDLWREAYNTATEVDELMKKVKVKPKPRSEYYEYLGQIFWKSENHLFHAFACLKNVLFVKAFKKDLSKEDLQTMASKAVMATLCVPFQRKSDIHATLELTADNGQASPYEKAKRHASLFSAQSVPTRDSIISSLIEKNLLQHAAEPCQRLFSLIESDFTPLSLCQDAKPYLDKIADEDICGGKLGIYITPLQKIIFFRLMKQLSEVYASMTIENFERAASIVPFGIAEKWMANAARQQGINIQINYREKAIVFGATRKFDMKSMRQPLIEIGHKLQQAMQRVAPEEQNKKEKIEKQALYQNIVKRIEDERGFIRQRVAEIERRKEENERKKQEQDREAEYKRMQQEAAEAEAERKRLQEERNKREIEREEQRKKDAKMKETKEMLEQMKKQDESKPSNLKIAGKKIGDIQAEDIEKFSLHELEHAREVQVQRERQEKIRQRKLESKRVDHLSRAFREEEKTRLNDWIDQTLEKDQQFLEEARKQDEAEQRLKHQEGIVEKKMIAPFQDEKDKWIEDQLEDKRREHNQLVQEKILQGRMKAARDKIERARKRMAAKEADELRRVEEEKREAENRKRKAQEEKRRQQEEKEAEELREQEEKERAEEQARKEKEREAKAAKQKEMAEMADRAEAKRRERERELEERQRAGPAAEERDNGRGGFGRGGDRDRDNGRGGDDWRRGGDRDRDAGRGGDDWRRGGPRDRDNGRGGDDWRRGGDRADEDRGGRTEEKEKSAPWRRPAQNTKADEDEGWRRPAASAPRRGGDEDEQPSSPWGSRRGAAGGRREADDDKEWSRPAAVRRDPEPAQKAADEGDDDDDFQTVGKKKGKAKEAPPPEPAQEEDDDGFTAVTTGKKKKGGAAAPPPWRRASDAADGPSRGDAGGAPSKPAPWKRPQ